MQQASMVGSAGGGVTSAGSLRELVERLRAQPRFALPTGNGGGSVGSGGGSDCSDGFVDSTRGCGGCGGSSGGCSKQSRGAGYSRGRGGSMSAAGPIDDSLPDSVFCQLPRFEGLPRIESAARLGPSSRSRTTTMPSSTLTSAPAPDLSPDLSVGALVYGHIVSTRRYGALVQVLRAWAPGQVPGGGALPDGSPASAVATGTPLKGILATIHCSQAMPRGVCLAEPGGTIHRGPVAHFGQMPENAFLDNCRLVERRPSATRELLREGYQLMAVVLSISAREGVGVGEGQGEGDGADGAGGQSYRISLGVDPDTCAQPDWRPLLGCSAPPPPERRGRRPSQPPPPQQPPPPPSKQPPPPPPPPWEEPLGTHCVPRALAAAAPSSPTLNECLSVWPPLRSLGAFTAMRRALSVPPYASALAAARDLISVGPGENYKTRRAEQNAHWAAEAVARGGTLMREKGAEALNAALRAYADALEFDPNFADAYVARGAAFVHGGRLKEASAEFEKALKLRPDHERAIRYREAVRDKMRAKQAQAHGQAHRRSGGGADGGATMAALAADESVADASTAESRTGAGATSTGDRAQRSVVNAEASEAAVRGGRVLERMLDDMRRRERKADRRKDKKRRKGKGKGKKADKDRKRRRSSGAEARAGYGSSKKRKREGRLPERHSPSSDSGSSASPSAGAESADVDTEGPLQQSLT